MWRIELDGDLFSDVVRREHLGVPKSCRVSGMVATKQDLYKLVDRLCESLGIPDNGSIEQGYQRAVKDSPQA